MPIALYLAMTAAEFSVCTDLPPHVGWLACHFSPSGPGLSNIPKALPKHSLLMIDDSTPFHYHQPEVIVKQLRETIAALEAQAVILDFQRPGDSDVKALAAVLRRELPCPVAATAGYALGDSPVFVPPCPLHRPLKAHLAPYQGREIWLEIALDGQKLHVTEKGCSIEPFCFADGEEFPHQDECLHCHYKIVQAENSLIFYLQRTQDDLFKLLEEAEHLGVTQAVGLWLELNRQESFHPDARLPKQESHDKITPSNMFEF